MESKMDVTVDRERLLDALKRVKPIAESRSTLPILSHVLLECKDDHLFLVATDLDVGIRVNVPCSMAGEGAVTLPVKTFLKLAKGLPKRGLIMLRSADNFGTTISCGALTTTIAGMDPQDYPLWSDLDAPMQEMEPGAFKKLIDSVVWAAAGDDSRYKFNTVLFHHGTLVATDGHRMAWNVTGEDFTDETDKRMVPKWSLIKTRQALNGDKSLVFGFEEKNMVVRTENFTLTARLVDGDYPDYTLVIPRNFTDSIQVNRKGFLAALETLSPLTSERNKGVTVRADDGDLVLTAKHPDLGEARVTVPAVTALCDGVNKIFNLCYLADALGAMDSDEIDWLHNAEGPAVFQPVPEGNAYSLLMPMRK